VRTPQPNQAAPQAAPAWPAAAAAALCDGNTTTESNHCASYLSSKRACHHTGRGGTSSNDLITIQQQSAHLLRPACACLSQVKLPLKPLQLSQQQQRPGEVRVGIQPLSQQLTRLCSVAFTQLQASPRDPA
jgi:hypothetical protein